MGKVYCSLPEYEEAWRSKKRVEVRIEGKKKYCWKTQRLWLRKCAKYHVRDRHGLPTDHTTDMVWGFTYEYETTTGAKHSEDSKDRTPYPLKKKPTEKGIEKGGTGERQENLYVTLPFMGKSVQERWCRLACLTYKDALKDGTKITYDDMKEEVSEGQLEGQTVYIIDHKNTKHTDSCIQNLQIIRRKDDPHAKKLRKAKTTTTTTTTTT